MGRFIPGESVDAAQRWQFGQISGPGGASGNAALHAQEASQQQEVLALEREAAFQQGFDAGVATARELAAREIEAFLREQGVELVQRLGALGDGFAHELDALRDALAVQVTELAREIARQVLRSELATRPEAVAEVVREALALLAQEHAPRVVMLHPHDLQLVQQQFAQSPMDSHSQVQWQADATLARGGCRIECAGTVIDGSLARRWQQAVDLLGVGAAWEAPPHDAA